MFFALGLDATNQVGIACEFFSSVIPGRPKDEPGIHFAACASGRMDSGPAPSAHPGMTEGESRTEGSQ
jgi:hypothetical protein